MKTFLLTFLLLITTVGYSQQYYDECPGILLGKTYQDVLNNFKPHKEYNLIAVSDSSLIFWDFRNDVMKTYFFKKYKGKKLCSSCSITLDCLQGEELIGKHKSNWISISDMKWEFDTEAYDIPLTVTLTYVDGFMEFKYNYIPKKVE